MPSFNLITGCWIPVRDSDRNLREVSLREALLDAPRLLRIEDPSPLVEVVLHRLLLAVLHRALDGPADSEDVLDWWDRGSFPENRLNQYLDTYEDRFDLFHPRYPFYQIPDLPDENPLPWTKLLPEKASGNNPTLFDHSVDDAPPYARPAEIARALLVHQAFTPGGLIRRLGVSSGAGGPLSKSVVFLAVGNNLFETLLLNLAPYRPEGDMPLWEREPYHVSDVEGGKARENLWGRTRVYTWLSRAVRLLPELDGRVRFMAYGPGVFPIERPFSPDPMCGYVQDDSGEFTAVRFSVDRAFWRDFVALLPQEGHRPPRVLEHARSVLMRMGGETTFLIPLAVLGQITDPGKPAKIVSVRREVYPFPIMAWDADAAAEVRVAVAYAEEIGKRLYGAGLTLARSLLSPGDRQPEKSEIARLLDSLPLLSVYWSGLEVAFAEFLTTLARDGRDLAHSMWVGAVEAKVVRAWNLTLRVVGVGSRHLKAVELAERRIAGIIGSLRRG